jgi:hypothetical protein
MKAITATTRALLAAALIGLLAGMVLATQPESDSARICAMREQLTELTNSFYQLQAQISSFGDETLTKRETAAQRDELERQLNALYFTLRATQDQLAALGGSDSSVALVAGRNGAAYLTGDEEALRGWRPADPAVTVSKQSLSALAANSLRMSGYLDMIYSAPTNGKEPGTAGLNQVYFDLSRDLGERGSAYLGVGYDDVVELQYANIGYKFFEAGDDAHGLVRGLKASVGQFDVPFGEDINAYSSNVRKTISEPVAVNATHGMWNDVGAHTQLGLSFGTLDAWLVRGFNVQTLPDANDETHELSANVATGARLNWDVLGGLYVGASASRGWLRSGGREMSMVGAHAAYADDQWEFKAEAMQLNADESGAVYSTRGGYLQALRNIGPLFAVTRGDYVDTEATDVGRWLSGGLGAKLGVGIEVRAEQQFDLAGPNNHRSLLQVVATL